MSNTINKKDAYTRRIEDNEVVPIRWVAGAGSIYTQAKFSPEAQWPMGEQRVAPKTNALGEAFFRYGDEDGD